MATRIIRVDPRKLTRLERNARFMRHETYQQLVNNVRRDGELESVPLAAWVNPEVGDLPDDAEGKWIVLSGNHRTMAAIDAGLEFIDLKVHDRHITRDEFIAKQLSHNAITGEDDPATLKQLYEEIDNIDWRLYAGLDDKTLELLEDVQIGSLSEANLSFQSVNIVFLPNEVEAARTAWEDAKRALAGDETWMARMRDYDAFLDALEVAGGAHNVTNVATELLLVLSIFKRHVADLQEGWVDEEAEGGTRHPNNIPLPAVFGTMKVPGRVAEKLRRAMARWQQDAPRTEEGERPPAWHALEAWADEQLAQSASAIRVTTARPLAEITGGAHV